MRRVHFTAAPRRWLSVFSSFCLVAAAFPLAAQTDYRNTDAGHPLRIEDADASPRHSLDFQLAPLRLDRIDGGFYRWQLEPRVSYAVFPRTELKLRAPFAYREPGTGPRGGLVGIGVGAFHNVVIESPRMPALAVEGDMLLSSGGSLTTGKTYAIRGIATRTVGRTRVHSNVGYGTYRVLILPNGSSGVPPVPDSPCSLSADIRATSSPMRVSAACLSSKATVMPHLPEERDGSRWIVGMAVDRALPLRSLLIAADVFAERYSGLSRPIDWTAEVALRRQLTPRTVLESVVGRRFTGVSQASFLAIGLSTTVSARLLIPETR